MDDLPEGDQDDALLPDADVPHDDGQDEGIEVADMDAIDLDADTDDSVEPPAWFAFVGGPDPGGARTVPDPPHCIYRYELGGTPESLFCADMGGTVSFVGRPDHASSEIIFGHLLPALPTYPEFEYLEGWDPYVEEVHVLDLETGESELLTYHLYICYINEPSWRVLDGVFTLGGDIALLILTEHVHPTSVYAIELVVVTRAGERGEDLIPEWTDMWLIGQLSSGEIIVMPERPSTGRRSLVAVDLEAPSSRSLEPEDTQDLWSASISPDGQSFIFGWRSASTAETAFILNRPEGEVRLPMGEDDELVGWTAEGEVIIARNRETLLAWDGDTEPRELPYVGPPVLWFFSYMVHSSGTTGSAFALRSPGTILNMAEGWTAITAFEEGYDDRHYVTWLQGDEVQTFCGPIADMRGLEWMRESSTPMMLFSEGRWSSPDQNLIYLCNPDGTIDELLERHGLRGALLSHPRLD